MATSQLGYSGTASRAYGQRCWSLGGSGTILSNILVRSKRVEKKKKKKLYKGGNSRWMIAGFASRINLDHIKFVIRYVNERV